MIAQWIARAYRRYQEWQLDQAEAAIESIPKERKELFRSEAIRYANRRVEIRHAAERAMLLAEQRREVLRKELGVDSSAEVMPAVFRQRTRIDVSSI